ncbi:hypothetical protein H6F98_05115 [Microcoleus sp. FACHB-SPT15]|uniref:hypothetical protein n=1 Tax=Microcoleus sp. FACHB-SPT15 TaxID=2692830 RepID=UPI00177D1AAB|nr:hypothetical protein [Microcoleus sp. FACHB-SPT15]MBD1804835.1 hypothetical protein [Microcoleus sp. FACHB-SPT15]
MSFVAHEALLAIANACRLGKWTWKICDRARDVRRFRKEYGNPIGEALSAQSGITYKIVV